MTKLKAQMILAAISLFVGLGVFISSFLVDPVGVIDPSVLTGLGMLLTFVGSVFGIDSNYKIKELMRNTPQATNEEKQ